MCVCPEKEYYEYIQHVFAMTSLGSLSNPHPLWETFLGHFQQQSLIHSAMNHSIGVLISCPGWKAKTNFVFHQLQWQCVDKARFLVISGTPCTHHLVSVPNTVSSSSQSNLLMIITNSFHPHNPTHLMLALVDAAADPADVQAVSLCPVISLQLLHAVFLVCPVPFPITRCDCYRPEEEILTTSLQPTTSSSL